MGIVIKEDDYLKLLGVLQVVESKCSEDDTNGLYELISGVRHNLADNYNNSQWVNVEKGQ